MCLEPFTLTNSALSEIALEFGRQSALAQHTSCCKRSTKVNSCSTEGQSLSSLQSKFHSFLDSLEWNCEHAQQSVAVFKPKPEIAGGVHSDYRKA